MMARPAPRRLPMTEHPAPVRQKGYIVVQDNGNVGAIFGFFEDELEADKLAESKLADGYPVLVIPAVRYATRAETCPPPLPCRKPRGYGRPNPPVLVPPPVGRGAGGAIDRGSPPAAPVPPCPTTPRR